ncbi:MAG: hypothetical protein WCX84_08285 [Syntrophales bacterium]|jgi:hypothetical protein|nr:hypothetical protein [Syntrophales bacterium]NLN60549.1 hypothetical protein [Deltaproteobacteria bacterium]
MVIKVEDGKDFLSELLWYEYDDADKPFDFIGTDTETAMICVTDDAIREKITADLAGRDFYISEVNTAKEAVKKMRFHVYTLLVIDENFDTTDPDRNDLLRYLATVPMSTRRRMFISLLSTRLRTLDRMGALTRSVNMIINTQNIKDFITLITNGIAENEGFYHTFTNVINESGKI